MGLIEAGVAVIGGRVVENARVPGPVDAYYDVVLVPGFSDGHAHPQVVDAGLARGRVWRSSYEWMRGRRLSVDEVGIRRDTVFAARLASLVFARALLEGVTLVAVTGRLAANILAWTGMPERPRAVFLPSVMDVEGWSLDEVRADYEEVSQFVGDGLARLGVFVHSLGMAGAATARRAIAMAAERGGVLGLHFSEGVREADRFRRVFGDPPYPARIVAVHCIEESLERLGVPCIACPASNLLLYGRTRSSLRGVRGLGSDWPLLLGTVARHLPLARRVFRGERLEALLSAATVGSYRAYSMPYGGDLVAFDGSLDDVLEARVLPRLVAVAGRVAVDEGRLATSGLSHGEVERMIEDALKEAHERYGVDGAPPLRPLSSWELLELLPRAPSGKRPAHLGDLRA
ncbi:MAG: hypothetical protein ABWW70_03025 [Thermoproteota archaeon]